LTSTIEKAVALMAKMGCMLVRPLCLQILTIDDKVE
jgi:homoserine dehydrogenase